MIEKPKKENLLGILKNNRFPILSSSLLGLGTLYIVNTYLNKESNKKENNFISFIFDNKKKISGGIALLTFGITKTIISNKIEKKEPMVKPRSEEQKIAEQPYSIDNPIFENKIEKIMPMKKLDSAEHEIEEQSNLTEYNLTEYQKYLEWLKFKEYKKWLKKNIKNIKRHYNNKDITFDNFWNGNKKNCIKILKDIKYNINIDYFSKEIINEFKGLTFTFSETQTDNNFKYDIFYIKIEINPIEKYEDSIFYRYKNFLKIIIKYVYKTKIETIQGQRQTVIEDRDPKIPEDLKKEAKNSFIIKFENTLNEKYLYITIEEYVNIMQRVKKHEFYNTGICYNFEINNYLYLIDIFLIDH